MGFWQKVKEEMNFSGVNRKTLSIETGISIQAINRAIERDSNVYLIEALKVAKFFDKPVEYFLDEPIVLPSQNDSIQLKKIKEEKEHLNLYRKYSDLIHNCEAISEVKKDVVKQLAQTLAQESPSYTSSKK